MSKSEKMHISVTLLLITFFDAFFKNFFNGFEISVKFCVFLIPCSIKINFVNSSFILFRAKTSFEGCHFTTYILQYSCKNFSILFICYKNRQPLTLHLYLEAGKDLYQGNC
jgi:hypothetical protein